MLFRPLKESPNATLSDSPHALTLTLGHSHSHLADPKWLYIAKLGSHLTPTKHAQAFACKIPNASFSTLWLGLVRVCVKVLSKVWSRAWLAIRQDKNRTRRKLFNNCTSASKKSQRTAILKLAGILNGERKFSLKKIKRI